MSPEKKRLAFLVAVLLGISAMAFWPRGASLPPPPRVASARPSRSGTAGTSGSMSPEQVPTLVPTAGLVGIAPVKRDIFHFYIAPTRVPTVPPPTPTPLPMPGGTKFIGPMPIPPTPTPTPIVPPAIPYKLVGLFGSQDRQIAAFEDNGRLINAREGDVLDGKFIVRKVNKESVDFAFVGLPNDITRRLAMAAEAAR